ncbi:MAG: calcium/sodium antiporter [Bacteroidota bacterium]|nr:calcium/sodium antiporter [Bacteroidota bacterium]
MSPLILLLLGFILLFFGGELLVRGAVSLALKIKISTLVVGMTVVSFATSAPELFVSLHAIFEGSSNIALGNAIGSNIANITLVLGVTAIIFRVKISKQTLSLNYPMMLGASFLLGGVLYFFKGIPVGIGFLFVVVLLFFVWFLIVTSRKERLQAEIKQDELLELAAHDTLLKSIVFLILGVVLLKYGADSLVYSAKILAKNFGISDRIIAVTVVAIGTSIPELATSIIAALRKEDNLAIGNLIGSNIFNILAVLGITAAIKEINIDDYAIFSFDYFWMMVITLTLGLFIYLLSKNQISRKEGVLLVLLYISYMYQNLSIVI